MKKVLLSIGFVIAVLIVLILVLVFSGLAGKILESKGIEKRIFRVDYSVLSDPGIHIIMAGTGTPNHDPIRTPSCVAVIAGGEFLLFDAGDGCTRTLDSMNLPILNINTVFLTHFHSDHINGLGHLISFTWVQGRKEQIQVYGPPGVDNLVQGIAAAAKVDITLRADPDSLFPLDPKLAIAGAHAFSFPDDGTPIVVWQKNGVVVKAFKNDHVDVKDSVGYRIEYKQRVVVISGDTVKSDYVIQNAHRADLLIHDTANYVMIEEVARVCKSSSSPSGIRLGEQILCTVKHHANTLDVAHVAKAAKVGKLVLTHIGPGIPDIWFFRNKLIKGMSEIYLGPIIVSKDGDRFYLDPGGH